MNWLLIVYIVFFLVMGFVGYKRGFIRTLFGWATLFLSVFLTGLLSPVVLKWISSEPKVWQKLLTYAIVFVVILLVLKLISSALKIVKRIPLVGPVNSVLGIPLGILEAWLILCLLDTLVVLLHATDFGITMTALIEENGFLTWFHKHNFIYNIFIAH